MLSSGVVLLVLIGLRWALVKTVSRRVGDVDARLLWRQMISWAIVTTAILILSTIWFDGFGSVLAVFSLVAAALTIVNKEFVLNMTASTVIVWRRLFSVGDRIQIGAFSGEVIDMGPLFFTLAERSDWAHGNQMTGRAVKVPNAHVLTMPVVNYRGVLDAVWHEVDVVLSPDSDLEAAESVVLDLANQEMMPLDGEPIHVGAGVALHPERYHPTVYFSARDKKIVLTVRYLCRPGQVRDSTSRLWRRLIEISRDQSGIQLA